MPFARALQVISVVLVVTLSLAGVVPDADGGTVAALPHDQPEDPDGNVTVLRADGNLVGAIDDSADLRRARTTGTVRSTTHVVPGDLLVLQFRSEHVNETFARIEGSHTTDRFFRLLNATDVNLSVEGRNYGPSQLPTELRLNRSNVAVLHDSENATFSLLIDTGNVSLVERNDGDPVRRDLAHLEFEAAVEIPSDDGDPRILVGGSKFRPPAVSARSPDAGAHLQVTPATVRQNATDNLTVNATTTLLPGSNLTVRAVAPDGTILAEQRVRTREPEGASDQFGGSVFWTTLAVGSLDPDDEFDLVVSGDEPIEERRVVVGAPPRMWNTTAELVTDGEHEGQIAVSTTLELPDSGFLLVFVDGEPVTTPVPGDSRVRPTMYVDRSAVDEERGEVYVLAVWDVDGDGVHERSDRLFRTSVDVGASRQDSELDVLVPVEGWETETPTPSPSPTLSPPSTIMTPTPSPTTSTPGFGLFVAAVAVVAAAVVRTRRR